MRKRIARVGTALLVVLALGGSAASAAQAHEWTVDGSPLTATATLKFPKASELNFEYIAPGTGVITHWHCPVTSSEGTIQPAGKGTLRFAIPECLFEYSGGTPKCTLITVANPTLNGELTTVEGGIDERLTPATGKVAFEWKMGSTCKNPGLLISAEGSFSARIPSPGTALEHAFETSPAINDAAGTNLGWLGGKVRVTATWTNALGGTFAGKQWAAK
jgi:hypothetical protein